MHKVELDNSKYKIPENWNEIPRKKVIAYLSMVYGREESHDNRIKVIRSFIPVNDKTWNKLTPEQIYALLNLVYWFWITPTQSFLFKSFRHRGRTYLTPDANFSNLTFGEFVVANGYFQRFTNKNRPDLKALDFLTATICRPERKDLDTDDTDWDGDYREKYNSKICEQRANELSDLPVGIKIAAANYWVAGMKYIHKNFKKLWEDSDDSQPVLDNGLGWVNTMFSVAEEGTFGKMKEVEYENLMKILFYLTKKKKDFDASKEANK